jgi:hypothetical protein
MCLNPKGPKAVKYTPPPIAAPEEEVAPMQSPETAGSSSTEGVRESATRKKLRIDLAPAGGTGLNIPS